MENEPFGISKKESIYKQFIGKWIIIYPRNTNTFAGKLREIKEEFAVLNPHQSVYYDKEKGLIRNISKKNAVVSIIDICVIEPTTKKSLEASCEYLNHQNIK